MAGAGFGGFSAALRLPKPDQRVSVRLTFKVLRRERRLGALQLDRFHPFHAGPMLPPGTNSGAIKIDVNGQSVQYATALTSSQSGGLVLSDSGSGGILRLTQANAYTGGTILNSGELDLDNNGGLGSGTLTINGGRLVSRTTSRTLSNAVTVGGDFTLNKAANGLNFNLSGTIDLGGAVRTVTVSNGTGSSTATFSNVISNSNGGLTKAGLGTLLLTGANTYTGATSVTEGTLSVSGSGKLGSVNNSLAVSSGATVDLNGTSQGVGALTGAGTIDNVTTGTTNTLTVGNNNATGGDFSGAIKNTTGTVSVTKTGTGTQTFSGINTYSGTTQISSGTLVASASGALGSGTVNNSGKLQVTGGITLNNAITTHGETNANPSDSAGAIESAGSNTLNGNINFGNTGGLITNVISSSGALAIAGNMSTTLGSGRTFNFGGAGDTTVSGSISDGTSAVAISKNGAGSLTLEGTNSYTGTTIVSAGTLFISGSLGATNVSVSGGSTIGAGDASGSIGGNLHFASGAILDVSFGILTVGDTATVSFDGFDFTSLVGFNVESAAIGTYTLIGGDFTLDSNNIAYYGIGNAFTRLDGNKAYFDQGSLTVTITAVPEPAAALFGGLGMLVLLRRRR